MTCLAESPTTQCTGQKPQAERTCHCSGTYNATSRESTPAGSALVTRKPFEDNFGMTAVIGLLAGAFILLLTCICCCWCCLTMQGGKKERNKQESGVRSSSKEKNITAVKHSRVSPSQVSQSPPRQSFSTAKCTSGHEGSDIEQKTGHETETQPAIIEDQGTQATVCVVNLPKRKSQVGHLQAEITSASTPLAKKTLEVETPVSSHSTRITPLSSSPHSSGFSPVPSPSSRKGSAVVYRGQHGKISSIDYACESYELDLGGGRFVNVPFESDKLHDPSNADSSPLGSSLLSGTLRNALLTSSSQSEAVTKGDYKGQHDRISRIDRVSQSVELDLGSQRFVDVPFESEQLMIGSLSAHELPVRTNQGEALSRQQDEPTQGVHGEGLSSCLGVDMGAKPAFAQKQLTPSREEDLQEGFPIAPQGEISPHRLGPNTMNPDKTDVAPSKRDANTTYHHDRFSFVTDTNRAAELVLEEALVEGSRDGLPQPAPLPNAMVIVSPGPIATAALEEHGGSFANTAERSPSRPQDGTALPALPPKPRLLEPPLPSTTASKLDRPETKQAIKDEDLASVSAKANWRKAVASVRLVCPTVPKPPGTRGSADDREAKMSEAPVASKPHSVGSAATIALPSVPTLSNNYAASRQPLQLAELPPAPPCLPRPLPLKSRQAEPEAPNPVEVAAPRRSDTSPFQASADLSAFNVGLGASTARPPTQKKQRRGSLRSLATR